MRTISWGDGPVTQSGTAEIDVSDDGQAFTLTWADFQVEINSDERSPSTMVARWEWFVLPVLDHPEGGPYTIAVRGHAVVDEGALATVMVSINGRLEVIRLDGHDGEFVRAVETGTTGVDTLLRVAVGVVVEGLPEAAAVVTVGAVDGHVEMAVLASA